MTTQQAKEMDMVDYLSKLGYEPTKIKGRSYWYLSPLRDEKIASFIINCNMNRWYDFGEGKGGSLVDFGILYYQCSVSELLQKLDSPSLSINQQQKTRNNLLLESEERNPIKILSVQEISSYSLINYLRSRRIEKDIADKYLKEVHFKIGDKTYFALGFRNNAGGYEFRNEYFKISNSPKDFSFMDNGAGEVAVFEGFFNFLSYKNMYYRKEEPLRNYLILNSASFFDKSLSKMHEHNQVHLYLDNDQTGEKWTQLALDLDSRKFIDERSLYHLHNDLNDWLVDIGQSKKQKFRQKP